MMRTTDFHNSGTHKGWEGGPHCTLERLLFRKARSCSLRRAFVVCKISHMHHLELQTPVQWWGASSRRSVAAVCRTAAFVAVLRLCSHDPREAFLVPIVRRCWLSECLAQSTVSPAMTIVEVVKKGCREAQPEVATAATAGWGLRRGGKARVAAHSEES